MPFPQSFPAGKGIADTLQTSIAAMNSDAFIGVCCVDTMDSPICKLCIPIAFSVNDSAVLESNHTAAIDEQLFMAMCPGICDDVDDG